MTALKQVDRAITVPIPFFNGKSESIYLKVPFILDIIEQGCENDEEIECSSSITTSKTG